MGGLRGPAGGAGGEPTSAGPRRGARGGESPVSRGAGRQRTSAADRRDAAPVRGADVALRGSGARRDAVVPGRAGRPRCLPRRPSGQSGDYCRGRGGAGDRNVAERGEDDAAARPAERDRWNRAAKSRARDRTRSRNRSAGVRVRGAGRRRARRRRRDYVRARWRLPERTAHRRDRRAVGLPRAAAPDGHPATLGGLRAPRAGLRDVAPRPDDGSALRLGGWRRAGGHRPCGRHRPGTAAPRSKSLRPVAP